MEQFDVRWRSFRGFADSQWMKVRPLTVLIGANNSGKTSLVAPLLLMKQTMTGRDQATALATRGIYGHFGTYRDLVYGHDSTRRITFSIRASEYYGGKADSDLGGFPPHAVDLEFEPGVDSRIELALYRVWDPYGRRYLTRKRAVDRYTLEDIPPRFPHQTAPRGRRPKTQLDAQRAVRAALPDHFLFASRTIVDAGIAAVQRLEERELQFGQSVTMYLAVVDYISRWITRLLDAIDYVGPLREPPRRVYELGAELPADVGVRGQHAGELLFRSRELQPAVGAWLRRFGIATDVRTRKLSDDSFALLIRRSRLQPWVNYADTGFGLSQVLPLIIQVLTARAPGILVAEQPEIHLNPRQQGGLADLFAAAVRRGQGVWVETHSEHLLVRLRTLIADGVISHSDVGLYYVEGDDKGSVVRPISINEDGDIAPETWPAGFFDQSIAGAFELADAQLRRQRREARRPKSQPVTNAGN